jgi:hypothetical protein
LYIARRPRPRLSRCGSVLQNSLLDHIPARRWALIYSPHRNRRVGRGKAVAGVSSLSKNATGRLHYDFRLAIHGVLVSWAMPRSLDGSCRETSGHTHRGSSARICRIRGRDTRRPIRRWDGDRLAHGHVRPENSIPPDKQLAQDKIGVALRGAKLRGSFTLNSNPKAFGRSQRRKRWLLIKNRRNCAPRALAVFPSSRHRRPGQL